MIRRVTRAVVFRQEKAEITANDLRNPASLHKRVPGCIIPELQFDFNIAHQGFLNPDNLRIIILCCVMALYYSMTEATRPDPTVRPPSRIAKVRPCSIATGWISSMVISTLSPGMHISTPSGRVITPVTSVVRK